MFMDCYKIVLKCRVEYFTWNVATALVGWKLSINVYAMNVFTTPAVCRVQAVKCVHGTMKVKHTCCMQLNSILVAYIIIIIVLLCILALRQ